MGDFVAICLLRHGRKRARNNLCPLLVIILIFDHYSDVHEMVFFLFQVKDLMIRM